MRRSPTSRLARSLPRPNPLGWVVAATFLHFSSFYYLVAPLPLYVLDRGGSKLQVGLIIGVFSVSSLATRPLFGAWMDRVGRRRFLMAGATIYVVASLGYLAIQSVSGILAWRAFHALGLAAFSTAAASLAGDLAPSRRLGATMGTYGLAQAAALSLGPGIGSALHRATNYSGLFLAAALTAVGALACSLAVPETLPVGKEAATSGRRTAAGESLHAVALPAIVQFAASIAYGSIVAFIAVVARNRDLNVLGAFFVLLALSSLGVRLVAGRAYDRWGPVIVLGPSLLFLAAGMAVLATTRHAGPFLGAAVLAGMGIGSTHTTLLARVVERSPAPVRGRTVALFTSCWELGAGGGTIFMGYLAEVIDFSGMYLVAACLPLFGLVALRSLQRH